MRRVGLLLLALLCSAPSARASVIVVDVAGGGDHLTLTAAVAAAANGDTILVRSGVYIEPGLVVVDGKSLTIAGDYPGVGGLPVVTIQPGLIVRNLAPGKPVLIQNLALTGAPSSPGNSNAPLILRDNVSHVRLQQCRFLGGVGSTNSTADGLPGIDAINSLSVALVGCRSDGGEGHFGPNQGDVCGQGGPALAQEGGSFVVYDSELRGGRGGSDNIGGCGQAGHGGQGYLRLSGPLLLVGSSTRGGDGGIGFYGGDGGDGGDGLHLVSLQPALLLGGTTASGGIPGFGDNGHGSDGIDIYDPRNISSDFGGVQRGFELSSPVEAGGLGSLKLDAPASDFALVFFSLDLHQLPYPGYQGALMLAPSMLLGPVLIGPPGNLSLGFGVPPLSGGLQSLDVHVQPAYIGPSGARLGPARVLTLVDA
jgi:hypothetical protein